MAFGKSVGGGRRIAPRLPIEVPASLGAIGHSGVVVLADISTMGAKLRGRELPRAGHDVWMRVGPVDVLARVLWSAGDQCGVAFDVPLRPRQLQDLRSARERAQFLKLSPEQKLIADDWLNGLAR